MVWGKKINYTLEKNGFDDYEYKNPDGVTIRISSDKKQGFPGSNQVVVLGGNTYGGWLLGTPKNFKTKSEAIKFANKSMKMINKGDYGKKIPFPY